MASSAFGGGTWDFSSAEFFPSRGEFDDVLDGHATRSERVPIALVAYLELTREVQPGHLALINAEPEPAPEDVDFRGILEAAGFTAPSFDRYRWRDREVGGYRSQFAYQNCLPDAFKTAAETFAARSARYGANSVELERWVAAQIQVFSHCSADSLDRPAPAGADWGPLERHDRAYQIAAASFYAERYVDAAERFAAIADTPSPWRDIAAYLVARTHLRRAGLAGGAGADALTTAARQADRLANDVAYRERLPAIVDLHRQIEIRRDPDGTLARLAGTFLDDPDAMSPRDFRDLVFFLTHRANHELALWVHEAVHGPLRRHDGRAVGEDVAWKRFQAQKQIEWLILAMAESVSTDGADKLEQLVNAAASEVPPSSMTVPFKRLHARLLGWLGRRDEARAIARELLEYDDLSTAAHNRIQLLLAENASSWSEYSSHAALVPAEIRIVEQTHPRRPAVTRSTRLLPEESAAIVNAHASAATMIEQAERADVGSYLIGRFALAAWTRAVIAGDTRTAERSAAAIARSVGWLAPAMRDYLNGDDAAFEAARILVKTPGMSPFVPADAGRVTPTRELLRDDIADGLARLNWWCPASGEPVPLPIHLDATITSAERAALSEAPASHFGPPILRYAESNPADARVPEALHRVVFAARHACLGGPGEISRRAFELLQRNYPDSPWAAKTPYWYD